MRLGNLRRDFSLFQLVRQFLARLLVHGSLYKSVASNNHNNKEFLDSDNLDYVFYFLQNDGPVPGMRRLPLGQERRKSTFAVQMAQMQIRPQQMATQRDMVANATKCTKQVQGQKQCRKVQPNMRCKVRRPRTLFKPVCTQKRTCFLFCHVKQVAKLPIYPGFFCPLYKPWLHSVAGTCSGTTPTRSELGSVLASRSNEVGRHQYRCEKQLSRKHRDAQLAGTLKYTLTLQKRNKFPKPVKG